jgi:hypothetical protein
MASLARGRNARMPSIGQDTLVGCYGGVQSTPVCADDCLSCTTAWHGLAPAAFPVSCFIVATLLAKILPLRTMDRTVWVHAKDAGWMISELHT